MARTTAPLFSLDASGSIADAIVYSKWRGRNYVRRHVVPANPRSGLQVGVRSVFRYGSQDWTNLSVANKTAWEAAAASDNITGLDAWQRQNINRARRNLGWTISPTVGAPTTVDPPTSLVVVEQPKTLVLSWTRPVANQGNYTNAVYLSTTMGFTADISNLVRVNTVSVVTVTIPGLLSGVVYFLRVRETDTGGQLGTLSAEATGTPD